MKRTELRRKSWMKRGETPLKKSGATKAKKVARQKKFYASYAWRKLRKEALARAYHRCEAMRPLNNAVLTGVTFYVAARDPDTLLVGFGRCEETERLQVHHVTNVRFGGQERPTDLLVLCKACHDREEAKYITRHPRRGRTP